MENNNNEIQNTCEDTKVRQSRWRSWGLYVSLAALIAFCLKEFANIDISDTLDQFMDYLLPVVVGFGLVNDPTSKNTL